MTSASRSAIAALRPLDAAYAPTPLHDLPALARRLGIAQVLAKDESLRALGSFKSLGGTYAGLRALAARAGLSIDALLASRPAGQPALVCASDGNHGLAVAAAARFAGAPATVFLHEAVPESRARRISDLGAAIVVTTGTYDDAVDAAAETAKRDGAILVADTSSDPHDPVVGDVMAGYGVMADEIRAQVAAGGQDRPTHLFVQAGVGGLAAAMAEGLAGWLAAPAVIVAVEPEATACVTAALLADAPVRIPGDLHSAAEMLSCGEASAPALAMLKARGARAISVSEAALLDAPQSLANCGGPATTASGAAGLAGLMRALADADLARTLGLDPSSRVLLVISEGAVPP